MTKVRPNAQGIAAVFLRVDDLRPNPRNPRVSTMAAAEKTGRICCSIDIEPKYVAVALERMSLLGLTPRLIA